ncbi:hypothetical protein BDR22DRAFT_868452 [Usnea florida]
MKCVCLLRPSLASVRCVDLFFFDIVQRLGDNMELMHAHIFDSGGWLALKKICEKKGFLGNRYPCNARDDLRKGMRKLGTFSKGNAEASVLARTLTLKHTLAGFLSFSCYKTCSHPSYYLVGVAMRTTIKYSLPFISPQRLPLVSETHEIQKLQQYPQQLPPKANYRKMYLRNLLALGMLVTVALSAAIPAPGKGKSVF